MRVAAVLAVALVACVRGGEKHHEKTVDTVSQSDVAAPDPWLEGQLPDLLQGTPRRGGTLVVRMQSEPPSLCRITDADLGMVWMLERKVYETLAVADPARHPDYPLQPLLAERWEISDDGRTLTFHLRRGVKWHDGRPFSGRDVVATVRKILDPKVRSMHLRSAFELLESIDMAPGDPFTVVARYREPYFLAVRSLARLQIFPAHVLDEAGDLLAHPIRRAPIGTGPFRFEEWKTADHISFVRHEEYWGRPAWLDRVTYRIVPDPTVAYKLLEQGEIDLHTALQPAQWAREMPASAFLRANYHRSRFFEPNYSWIGWNVTRPFFADARVRRAMTLLMDRESIRRSFLLGVDRATACTFYVESKSCDPALAPLPYDPAGARRLLDEAGWIDRDGDGVREKDGVPFRFTFLAASSSLFLAKLLPWLQQELAKYGIDMEIKRVEWALFLQRLREHDFDACSLIWGQNDVVSDPYSIWHSSQAAGGTNYISYANPALDALLDRARRELDDDARAALYRLFGRILHEENPYTILFNRPQLDAIRRTVRGLRPSVTWYDLQDAWLEP